MLAEWERRRALWDVQGVLDAVWRDAVLPAMAKAARGRP